MECLAEELLHLRLREAQFRDPDLGQLAQRPQSGDRDGGLAAAREHDREALRRAGDDLPGDQPDVGDLVGKVKVIEDQGRAIAGDRRKLGEEGLDRVLARRPTGFERPEEGRGRRRKVRVVLAPGGDEMRQEPDPVAILLVDPVPERPQPRSPREVGQERGLAVARVADHEHDTAVDLHVQPVQQARSGEGLVTKRRGLDLPGLDRIAAHAILCIDADASGRRDHRAPRADRDRRARCAGPPSRTDDERIGRRERYGGLPRTVNEMKAIAKAMSVWAGHVAHGGRAGSTPAYLRHPRWSTGDGPAIPSRPPAAVGG